MKRSNLLVASLFFMVLGLLVSTGLAQGQPAVVDGGTPAVSAPVQPAQPVVQPEQPKPAVNADKPKEGATTTLPDGTVTPSEPGDSDELNLDNLVKMTEKVWSDWRTYGWMAGVIALLNLLIFALRIKPLNDWLEKKDWKKYKPYVAAVLGAALMCLASLKTHVPILQSIVAGLMFGWTSSGLHQSVFPTKKA